MENNILNKIVGSGAGFPIKLTPVLDSKGLPILNTEGEPQMGWNIVKGDFNLVEQNLKSIIFTLIGSRIRQEEFGCRISELLEEPNTQVVSFLSSKYITDAIKQWEPRISQVSIKAIPNREKLLITANYRLVNSVTQGENTLELTYPE